MVCGFSFGKKISSAYGKDNMRGKFKQRKYIGTEKKDEQNFREQ